MRSGVRQHTIYEVGSTSVDTEVLVAVLGALRSSHCSPIREASMQDLGLGGLVNVSKIHSCEGEVLGLTSRYTFHGTTLPLNNESLDKVNVLLDNALPRYGALRFYEVLSLVYHLIYRTTLCGKYNYPCFTKEKTEAL